MTCSSTIPVCSAIWGHSIPDNRSALTSSRSASKAVPSNTQSSRIPFRSTFRSISKGCFICCLPSASVGTGPAAIFPFQPVLMPVGKLPTAHRTDFRAHSLPVLRLRMGVVPSGPALWGAELSWPAFMVRHDCGSTLRTEGKRHVLDHLSRVIFHLSSPSSLIFRRFCGIFYGKFQNTYEKRRSRNRPCPARLNCCCGGRSTLAPCSSRNKLEHTKSSKIQGFSCALVHFGKRKGTKAAALMPLHLPCSFCAVNLLTPGLSILRIFTRKPAPVSV